MREMDQLLRATARAEATHFWFRGFRRFVEPLLQRATERSIGRSAPGLWVRHRRQPRPARPFRPCLRLRSRPSSASKSATRPAGPGSPRPASPTRPIAERRLRRRHVLRRAVRPARPDRAGGGGGDVPGRQARRLHHRQRRRPGLPEGRSLGARPRGPALQPRLAVTAADRRRIHRRADHVHQRVPVSADARGPRPTSGGAACLEEADAESDISVPAAPINALLTGVLSLEAWWVPVLRQPVRQLAALSG